MLNIKYRWPFIGIGLGCIGMFCYNCYSNYEDIDALRILEYALPALILFGLAYKTYPPGGTEKSTRRQVK